VPAIVQNQLNIKTKQETMNQSAAQVEQPTDQPSITVEKKALPKIRSICVDTLTTIMKNDIHSDWGNGKMIQ
jgi:hypothetical protein